MRDDPKPVKLSCKKVVETELKRFVLTGYRFAEWVEGASHVSESEFDAFDNLDSVELPSYLETDDEDEIDFQLNSP